MKAEEKYPKEYEALFTFKESSGIEINEINEIKRASEEIDELRKVVMDVNSPNFSFGTANNASDFKPNFVVKWKG